MSTDFSVAPEIAQLVAPFVPSLAGRTATATATAGRRVAELTRLAAAPEAWWDLVRFDPAAPARVPVPGTPGAWLLITPPGAVTKCDCGYATLLAGEAAEDGRPLRPGRVLLHGAGACDGAGHRVRGSAHGYAVSLHLLSVTDCRRLARVLLKAYAAPGANQHCGRRGPGSGPGRL